MKQLLLLILFISTFSFGQEVLIYGRQIDFPCVDSVLHVRNSESIPRNLNDYDLLMIFSTANSRLKEGEEVAIQHYLEQGGRLYLGADNWPLVEECNQLMNRFYRQECYGNFDEDKLEEQVLTENSLKRLDSRTTVSFPMHQDLRVEAWSNDNPMVLSGKIGQGKIVLDGGYSRFYDACDNKEVLLDIINLLLSE
ncbi:MAG: hypothetical protein EP338_10935 [Bacteroidetes bacterium]|nr:MAG: hypothetical protein EP338_10935 [Bacteroidota bacterium]